MPLATETRVLTPSNVKHYLQQRGSAPLSDVVNRFDAPAEAVTAILLFWQQRGRVHRMAIQSLASCGSGSCGSHGCSTPSATPTGPTVALSNDLFTWVPSDASPVSLDTLTDFEASWIPSVPK